MMLVCSASRNAITWQKVPGVGAVNHYRLKLALRPAFEDTVEDGEERDATADKVEATMAIFRNAGGVVH